MKLPTLVAVEKSAEDEVVLHLEVLAALEAFKGHFPGKPILPGVVQIDWVVRFAGQYLGLGRIDGRDFQVKFNNIIEPDRPLALFLHYVRDKNRLSFTYRSGDSVMSSGHLRLGMPA